MIAVASGRECVWCGARPVTNEHIFRESWEERFMRFAAPGPLFSVHARPKGQLEKRPDRTFAQKVKRACRNCNGGWMNDADLAVQDLLTGLANDQWPRALTAEEVAAFRLWGAKTAVMRTFIDGEDALALPPNDLSSMFGGQAPTSSWQVFLGRARVPDLLHSLGGGWTQQYARPGVQDLAHSGLLQVTWQFGYVVVVVLWAPDFGLLDAPDGMLTSFADAFREANADEGNQLVELAQGGVSLAGRPRMELAKIASMALWAGRTAAAVDGPE